MKGYEYSWNENPRDLCEPQEKLKCPECEQLTTFQGFCSVGCEDCGEHSAIKCSKCDEYFDHVWGYGQIREYNKSLGLLTGNESDE